MPGKYLNPTQVKLYMKYRNQSDTQEQSASKAGFSERTGRTIDQGKHRLQKPAQPRIYKTRTSEIRSVFEDELVPMLEKAPELQAKTLFLYLERNHRNSEDQPIYPVTLLRSLQRYVGQWKALHGKEKEVMFPQAHVAGQQGLSDFTEFDALTILIQDKPFPHRFYHFRLVYSKWSYLKVIRTGESFQALSEGLQAALTCLGGAPLEHRTDSLSAAYKNASPSSKDDLTRQYEALCTHYGMTPTRNNKGKKHENGSVESSHGHLKNRIKQELLLRRSNVFASVDHYEQWVQVIVDGHNRRNTVNFEHEQQQLQSLPAYTVPHYESRSVRVSCHSTIRIKGMAYSVPSRLIGRVITLHMDQKQILGYLGSEHTFTLMRAYPNQQASGYIIDYRHIIHSLMKKPGALRFCTYRDDLFPSDDYRRIWQHLNSGQSVLKNAASKIMLRLLKLAADQNCQTALAGHVIGLIEAEQSIEITRIEQVFRPTQHALPVIDTQQHALKDYDCLIHLTAQEVRHDNV